MALGRKTGGRQRGTPNKITKEILEGARKTGLLPLEYMLRVMRNPKADVARRDDMAKAAAPYLHHKATEGMSVHIGGEKINGSAEDVGIQVSFVRPQSNGHDHAE